jgi:hypothetical protein
LRWFPSLNDPGFFTSFDPKPYEHALFQLVDVQDEISLARTRRAAQLVAGVPDKMAIIDAEIAKGNAVLQPTSQFGCGHVISAAQVQEAQAHADLTQAPKKEIEAELAEALTADEKNQGEAIKSIRADLDARRTEVDTIRSAAPKTWIDPPDCKLH